MLTNASSGVHKIPSNITSLKKMQRIKGNIIGQISQISKTKSSLIGIEKQALSTLPQDRESISIKKA